ncbi:unnamed protein product [Paramecium sonneborni]|uniref:Uncharacterized protein n=1 Tax=Paramecium sonneborni TaxID=65129 RepID=A0A8S1MG23_9CILI|nr:unnamed protein product [Paramecium sonneborni]
MKSLSASKYNNHSNNTFNTPDKKQTKIKHTIYYEVKW